jgi:hypothetical protein
MNLGRLERVSVREAWAHEAQDFTPWLLANASRLGEVLGMDLELKEAEHSVGDFSLDLMGEDTATGEAVIIENQLAKSDHSHLGQLLTYAGGTDAVNIVWIADEFRPEHRAALDWLNDRTNESTRFFAIEVSAVRIGDSPLAPLFEMIVQPNDWQKKVRSSTSGAPPSARRETYRAFWSQFLDAVHEVAPGWTNAKTPLAQNWMNLPAGVSNANYVAVFSKGGPRVEIYFSASRAALNAINFDRVLSHQKAIETAFGQPLEWDPLDGKKAARISLTRPGSIDDGSAWNEYVQWLVSNIVKLRNAIDGVGGLPAMMSAEGSINIDLEHDASIT